MVTIKISAPATSPSSAGRMRASRRCSIDWSAKRLRPFRTSRKRLASKFSASSRDLKARSFLSVDLVCLIRDASTPTGNGDRFVLDLVKQSEKPSLLLLNKTDRIKDKSKLLSLIEWYNSEHEWKAVVPISALKGDQVEQLLTEMVRHLPEGEPLFSEDDLTD
ncbi:MAG: hypothetical protein DMF70_00880, partial [Acidobacteria bacterium]